jgi:D-tyrosyl-tRNA(Tyr) deacylase
MRAVLQRVTRARVLVGQEILGEIAHGWLVLVGITTTDTTAVAEKLAQRIALLRAFEDDQGKMNRSVLDVAGSVLCVSNFTLYADCTKGRRPSFVQAARPEQAQPLYETFLRKLLIQGVALAEGRFGADMQIELVNDGPVTFVLDEDAGS